MYIVTERAETLMTQMPDPQWNATVADFPSDASICELFEARAAAFPGSIALEDGDAALTYSEINNRANRIARVLQAEGVKQGSIVCCHFRRSSAIVYYALAILKAGGTYVLSDAGMPKPRLEYILNDVQPVLVITDTSLPDLSLEREPILLTVAAIDGLASSQSGENLDVAVKSSSTAYIAYTSGSTGKPKGVMITHQATVNHATAFAKIFQLSPKDRVPLMAPIAFDMAMEEMVPPLLSGATLVVSKSRFTSMLDFHQEIVARTYSMLNIPAPLWQEWTEYLEVIRTPLPQSLRLVIAGSEEISTKTLRSWNGLPGADRVTWAAAYGTTETTITSTLYQYDSADDLHDEPLVPIGKPIANTYTYILDDAKRQVPVGAVGELYIGGKGLAAGYYKHEDMTKQSFVPDPFTREAGARMYRTGDMARYRPDGTVVWIGRKDAQIKRFGLRIEPAEIESVIELAPFVDEAVVVLRKAGVRKRDKQLVVFTTTKPGQFFDESSLRMLAIRHLPALMVPDIYINLPKLPLNSNGKTDRKSLDQYPM